MNPLAMSALLAGAGTTVTALPDIIPSKYERDQKKRLREMQRKQEMGALGLTDQQRAAIEGQMRGARQQAQQFAEAERERLTQPAAQPQMALLGQQMADESRQRLEADLASQILNIDLQRQQQQEQEIKDLEAAQAEYKRARAEAAVSPVGAGSEAAASQMALDRLLALPPEEQEAAINMMFLERLKQGAANASQSTRQAFSKFSDPTNISFRDAMAMNKPFINFTNLGLFGLPVSEQYRFLVQDQGMTPYEAEEFLGY